MIIYAKPHTFNYFYNLLTRMQLSRRLPSHQGQMVMAHIHMYVAQRRKHVTAQLLINICCKR